LRSREPDRDTQRGERPTEFLTLFSTEDTDGAAHRSHLDACLWSNAACLAAGWWSERGGESAALESPRDLMPFVAARSQSSGISSAAPPRLNTALGPHSVSQSPELGTTIPREWSEERALNSRVGLVDYPPAGVVDQSVGDAINTRRVLILYTASEASEAYDRPNCSYRSGAPAGLCDSRAASACIIPLTGMRRP